MLTLHLHKYIHNSESAQANFDLGLEYDRMGQTGAAISFYLRTAERSQTDVLQYEALLRMALCFERQRTRDDTEKVILQKAISLLPSRPEAYFVLSRLHEINKEWHDSYTVASIGLSACDFDLEPLTTDVQYPGQYGLLFEKGVSAWWVGQTEQSREIMHELKFGADMNEMFTAAVDRNLASIGWPNTATPYKADILRTRARVQFSGLKDLEKNYSQSYQDLFVLSATNGKRKGRYLEIGSAEPFKNNNTALLETEFDWTGVSIDINQTVVTDFMNSRSNLVFCLDATKIDYAKFLSTLGFAGDFDYLQIDCDPPAYSFEILKRIPFDQYRFAAITFEHDYYVDPTIRDQARDYLRSKGYVLAAGDIAYNHTHSYEDWWIHPGLVNNLLQAQLIDSSDGLKFAGDYLFPDPALVKKTPAARINRVRTTTAASAELINTDYQKGFWVVDNFYRDPDAIRAFALQQEYEPSGPGKPYIGSRTYKQFLFPGLQEEFERIMGEKITAWESHGMNGRFQFNIEGEPLVYHADNQKWAAMLYLTPNAPYETGTMTHALKGTDIRHSSHPEFGRCFRPGSRNLDKTPFEDVDIIGNVYNRLVIFNAGYLHSACGYFGWNQENSRLWQMFFFD